MWYYCYYYFYYYYYYYYYYYCCCCCCYCVLTGSTVQDHFRSYKQNCLHKCVARIVSDSCVLVTCYVWHFGLHCYIIERCWRTRERGRFVSASWTKTNATSKLNLACGSLQPKWMNLISRLIANNASGRQTPVHRKPYGPHIAFDATASGRPLAY